MCLPMYGSQELVGWQIMPGEQAGSDSKRREKDLSQRSSPILVKVPTPADSFKWFAFTGMFYIVWSSDFIFLF